MSLNAEIKSLGDIIPGKDKVGGWQVYQAAFDADLEQGPKIQVHQGEKQLLRAAALNELAKIGQTLCPECTGRGHTAKNCGTRPKLTSLGKTNAIARTLIRKARTTCYNAVSIQIAKAAKPNQFSWHSSNPQKIRTPYFTRCFKARTTPPPKAGSRLIQPEENDMDEA